MKTLYLDFDGTYKTKRPDIDTIVITNTYNTAWIIDVNRETSNRDDIYYSFENYCTEINRSDLKFNVNINKVYLFDTFFAPLGKWIATINKLIETKKIDLKTEIVFSSYSNNRKVFVFEAEAESNGQLLYKKSYFLSYYLNLYFINTGFLKIVFNKKTTIQAVLSFYLRGFIVLNLKTLQLLFYKLLIKKRNYNLCKNNFNKDIIAVSTRGIVQTQFIEGLYKNKSDRFLIIVNEASSRPFSNLNVAKKTFNSFFYAEGFLSFSQLFKEYFIVIKEYYINKKSIATFYNIPVNIYDLAPEIGVKNFHLKTYANSFNNAIKHLKKKYQINYNKFISFEMLPPFSKYINYKKVPKIQIQTTLILAEKYPNFIYTDQFYFSNKDSYKLHIKANVHLKEKFNLLHNIKYFGIKKQLIKKKFKTLTYFTQPIYYDEENTLILFLKEFCLLSNFVFKIKFHPRSSIPKINLDNVVLINGKTSSQEAIKNSDIVVTRHSSIGIDSWFMNVPILFFVNGTLKGDGVSYIPEDYLGNIKSDISIEELKDKLDNIIDNFYKHSFHKDLTIDNENLLKELFSTKYK